jgi:hypothetical protein
VGKELFGQNAPEMARLADPLGAMLTYLEAAQAQYPGKIIGFKWKPYYHHERYEKVWSWLVLKQVRIIYSVRNPLDVLISSTHRHEDRGKANCNAGKGAAACVKVQQSIKIDVVMSRLIPMLNEQKRMIADISTRLTHADYNYYDITYEEVNHGPMEERLAHVQALADFIQPGHTVTESVFNTSVVYIGRYHQREKVENYDEVVAALNGTRFARYLH